VISRVDRRPSWLQFAAWAACGAGAALILLAAFAFGPLAIVPAGLFAGIALLLGGANVSAVGAAAGVGAWGFVLGWLNRDGPGVVCTAPDGGMHCTEEWAPWPFWLLGAVLVLIPMILFRYLRRRMHRGPAA
jgi:hypothetical protein